jgi:molybdenum cofactor synthesis domain-containing protein
MARTAAMLVIGNEILSGKVQDANTQALALTLRGLGIELRRVVTVPDEVALIAAELNALRAQYDYVFTSGGVGPTHDDVTIAAAARALGRQVVRNPALESLLRGYYGARLTDGHLQMADVVEGTELHAGDGPTWPAMVLGNVFILPGVPDIFRRKLTALRPRLAGDEAPFVLRSVYTSADEGEIKPHLDATVGAFPDIAVGSYPRLNDPAYSVRVTFDGRDVARVEAAAADFIARLPPAYFLRAE